MNEILLDFFSSTSWRVDVPKLDFSGGPELAYSCISLIRYILRLSPFLGLFSFSFQGLDAKGEGA